jgi:hypothetical protein
METRHILGAFSLARNGRGSRGDMFRRRRRRSSFSRRTPPQVHMALIGVGVAVFVGLFVYFIGQSDTLAPEPQEMRVELPDAFKQ